MTNSASAVRACACRRVACSVVTGAVLYVWFCHGVCMRRQMSSLLRPAHYALVQDHMPFEMVPDLDIMSSGSDADSDDATDRPSLDGDSEEKGEFGSSRDLEFGSSRRSRLSATFQSSRTGTTEDSEGGKGEEESDSDAGVAESAIELTKEAVHVAQDAVETARAMAAPAIHIMEGMGGKAMDAMLGLDQNRQQSVHDPELEAALAEMPRAKNNALWVACMKPLLLAQGIFYFAWGIAGLTWLALSDTCSTTQPALFYTAVVDAAPLLISVVFCAWDWFEQ